VAVQGANVSHRLFEKCAPVSKPNRARSKSWNLGTQLPGVPLSGAKENTYFATAPARNLHDEPILLEKWSGAGASASSPGRFYEIRTLITYFSLPLPLPTLINCSLRDGCALLEPTTHYQYLFTRWYDYQVYQHTPVSFVQLRSWHSRVWCPLLDLGSSSSNMRHALNLIPELPEQLSSLLLLSAVLVI
jgi:hypothetical protein